MKILFICKYNRFRSRIAEAYFKKINVNRNIQASSAGIIIGEPVPKTVKQIARKLGFVINEKPKGIREKLLNETDLVIIVANNVPKALFSPRVKKIIVWKIPDTSQSDVKSIEKISKGIMKRVKELNKKLEVKK